MITKKDYLFKKLNQYQNTETQKDFPFLISNLINLYLKFLNKNYKNNIDFSNTEIDLSSNNINNVSPLAYLNIAPSSIVLDNNNIEDISAFKFINQSNLKELSLKKNKLTSIMNITCKALERLDIGNNKINRMPPILDASILTYLYISYNEFSNLKSLINFRNLTQLNLSGNIISVTDLGFLDNFSKLEFLNLENTNISDIHPLKVNKSLQKINLKNNNIPSRYLDELKASLPKCEIII